MTRRLSEVERKWLVADPPDISRRKGVEIIQGYVAVSPEGAEVRLRRKGSKFFETVKTGSGVQRGEIEIELSRKQFKLLWPTTRGRRLEKVRFTLKWHGKNLELDVYKKKLAGLKVVEVEFKSRKEAEKFLAPEWFGAEITEDENYKNANLATRKKTSTAIL